MRDHESRSEELKQHVFLTSLIVGSTGLAQPVPKALIPIWAVEDGKNLARIRDEGVEAIMSRSFLALPQHGHATLADSMIEGRLNPT